MRLPLPLGRVLARVETWLHDPADCHRRIERGPWFEDINRHVPWFEDVTREPCRAPIGPHNAISNLAYAVAGVVIFALDRTDRGAVMLLCLLALAGGSWRYHSRKTPAANTLDRVGMLMVFGALQVLAIDPHDPRIAIAMWGGALVVAVVFAYRIPRADLNQLMGMFLAVACLGAWLHGSLALGALSMALFGASYAIWLTDRRAAERLIVWCRDVGLPERRPRAPFGNHGHAVWHYGTAAAIVIMVLALIGRPA